MPQQVYDYQTHVVFDLKYASNPSYHELLKQYCIHHFQSHVQIERLLLQTPDHLSSMYRLNHHYQDQLKDYRLK